MENDDEDCEYEPQPDYEQEDIEAIREKLKKHTTDAMRYMVAEGFAEITGMIFNKYPKYRMISKERQRDIIDSINNDTWTPPAQ